MIRFIGSILFLALLLPACRSGEGQASERSPLLDGEDFVIHAVSVEELFDEVRSLDADVVVVNFWASWCAPCREEFPEYIRYDRAHDDVAVRFVSVDFEDDLEFVAEFLREQGVRGTTYLQTDTEASFVEAVNSEWMGTIPATALYDRHANQLDFWEGKATYEELARRVEEARARS